MTLDSSRIPGVPSPGREWPSPSLRQVGMVAGGRASCHKHRGGRAVPTTRPPTHPTGRAERTATVGWGTSSENRSTVKLLIPRAAAPGTYMVHTALAIHEWPSPSRWANDCPYYCLVNARSLPTSGASYRVDMPMVQARGSYPRSHRLTYRVIWDPTSGWFGR